MITILYFARFREILHCESEQFELSPSYRCVNDVTLALCERGDLWRQTLLNGQALIALNQEICNPDTIINDGDELAFFPPVTGG